MNKRQRKKNFKKQLLKTSNAQKIKVKKINTKIDLLSTIRNEEELSKAKKINTKINLLSTIKSEELSKAKTKELRALIAQKQSLKLHTGRQKKYTEKSYSREVGAMIKKYHDYVDRGLIKPRSFMDNYEQASWMRNEVLSKSEIESAIKQADEWQRKWEVRNQEKLQEELDFLKFFD